MWSKDPFAVKNITNQGHLARLANGTHELRIRGDFSSNTEMELLKRNRKDPAQSVYRKIFQNPDKKIWLPDEVEDFRQHLFTKFGDFETIALTGYTDIGPVLREQFGINQQEYEEKVFELFDLCIKEAQAEPDLAGVTFIVTHGASDMCVDRVGNQVAAHNGLYQVGFNQYEWMPYVKDDSVDVVVGANKLQYHNNFIIFSNYLTCVGGREDALGHDIAKGIANRKRLFLAPILPFIAPAEIPPAFREFGPDGEDYRLLPFDKRPIEDASRALPVIFEGMFSEINYQNFSEMKINTARNFVNALLKHRAERNAALEDAKLPPVSS